MQANENSHYDEIGPAEKTKPFSLRRGEKPHNAREPYRQFNRLQKEYLVSKESQRPNLDVFKLLRVAHHENLWPSVARLPDQVWEKHGKGHGPANPHPFRLEQTSLTGNQEAGHERKAEDEHRMFIFQTEPGDCAERKPQLRRRSLNHANRNPRA